MKTGTLFVLKYSENYIKILFRNCVHNVGSFSFWIVNAVFYAAPQLLPGRADKGRKDAE